MLKNNFFSEVFWRFFQSGFFFDFVYKKFASIFVYNVFIYTAQFFGEKYLIEVVTKKLIENCIFLFNKKTMFNTLGYSFFFFQFLFLFCYFFTFSFLLFFFA